MIPELTVQEAIGRVPPSCVLLTKNQASDLTGAITAGESLESGEVACFGHAMRMAENGQVWSQEGRLKKLPLRRWCGAYIRAWVDPNQTHEQGKQLLEDTELRQDTRYDWLATGIGQPLRFILPDWITDRIHIPWLNMCSEGVAEVQRKQVPGFCLSHGMKTKRPSPQDINDWCQLAGWLRITFKLVPDLLAADVGGAIAGV